MPNPSSDSIVALFASQEDLTRLRGILVRSNWDVVGRANIAETMEVLASREVSVVLCDPKLPDGTWRDVLGVLVLMANPPRLIVASHKPSDAFWAEVLSFGGYDVLSKPFVAAEVLEGLGLARRSWSDRNRCASMSACAC
jgi:DNA-binding response OmpR family regulator